MGSSLRRGRRRPRRRHKYADDVNLHAGLPACRRRRSEIIGRTGGA